MFNLNDFLTSLENSNQLIKIDDFVYEVATSQQHTKVITLVILTHGNEFGGAEIVDRFVNQLKSKSIPKSKIRIVISNPEAAKVGKRFLETDLNRSFLVANPHSYEEKRAHQIFEQLTTSDIVLDFHQTIEPCERPFLIFSYSPVNLKVACILDSLSPKITFKEFSSAYKGKGLTSSVSALGKIGLTIETGQIGYDEKQIQYGLGLIAKLDELDLDNIEEITPEWTNVHTWGETIINPERNLFLTSGFKNFDNVRSGDLLGNDLTNSHAIYCPIDGKILFPKYGLYREQSHELIRIIKKVESEKDLS